MIYFLGVAWTQYCLPHFKMYFGELKVFKCQKLRRQLSPRTAPILISNRSGHVACCVSSGRLTDRLMVGHSRAEPFPGCMTFTVLIILLQVQFPSCSVEMIALHTLHGDVGGPYFISLFSGPKREQVNPSTWEAEGRWVAVSWRPACSTH